MKKVKKMTALVLTVIMLFTVFAIMPITVNAASDYSLSVLDDGTAEISDYYGSAKNLTVPSKISGYKITGIGAYAFKDCSSLVTVTIPNTVTSIGRSAFDNCDSLVSITIPNSVKGIGENAFRFCYELKEITIPNSVTSIGKRAFEYCNALSKVKISASVTSIGEAAFMFCSNITTIIVDANNNKYDSRNNCNAIIETKTNTLLYGSLNTVIPDSVTHIGNNAFYSYRDLKTITIPDSVTSIGDGAFFSCDNIVDLTIPDSVKSIGDMAFQYCQGLKTITIPESVTSIGDAVFWGCDNMTAYVYENSYAHKYVVNNNIKYELIKSQPDIIIGDVNFDGNVNIIDATDIQKYSVGLLTFDDKALASADVNKDGIVNVSDSTLIQKYCAGLVSEF